MQLASSEKVPGPFVAKATVPVGAPAAEATLTAQVLKPAARIRLPGVQERELVVATPSSSAPMSAATPITRWLPSTSAAPLEASTAPASTVGELESSW